MLGRTISFADKVVWWRNFEVTSQVANPLRSIKFLNFRSLQTVEGNAIRWWKQLVRSPETKGANFSLTGDTRPFLTFIYLHPKNFSLLHLVAEISPSRSCSYFTSFLYSYSSPLASFSLLQLFTVSLQFLHFPAFSPLALTFPRLTFVFYASTGVLTVYFDLDLREISWNSLGAGSSLGKIPFCTQRLLSQQLRSGRNAAGM